MNKDKHMKKAQEFNRKGAAYIHCETTNGTIELAVGGDGRAILLSCYRIISRYCELTGASIEDVFGALEEIYEYDQRRGK